MKTISQREEQIMLAIWTLKDEAYLVGIKKFLSGVMKRNWTVGAIHKPLRRLEDAGYITFHLGEATAKRGGRAKKIYTITPKGKTVLSEYKRINDALWSNFPDFKYG